LVKVRVSYTKIKNKNIMKIENWVEWLQARIPELKASHNAFWVTQALSGCASEAEKTALKAVKPSKMPCGNCDVEQSVMYCEKCWDIANNS
jgi:hypothetical protein